MKAFTSKNGGDRIKPKITLPLKSLGVSLKSMGMVNKWPADPLHLLGHGFAAAALSAGNARFPPNHLTRISRTMWWYLICSSNSA
ncbi:hypothetical protein B296_00016962 [Ensete ventricosum]|uniref:Uncharacterized protein n=1 Tax=Ensete ventricosum TaxID=4639 RepID=A0A426ZZF9_ENSVE|nr:hypothetical protein B296_00016962 [Ensete ventricosum]